MLESHAQRITVWLLASERIGAARRWLGERSALGEFLDVDFATMGPMRLYRASDALMAHREAIERRLFDRAMDLFDLHPTVTLYDLTNTYFEGEAGLQPNARRGHSKDKCTDCPLLTLGLVLDASGFVRPLGGLRRRRADGATLHVRKATRAEPRQQAVYEALAIDPAPEGTRKTVV